MMKIVWRPLVRQIQDFWTRQFTTNISL